MMKQGHDEYVFQVDGIRTVFHTYDGDVVAVNGASFGVRAGEMIGIVGESGCGKSVTQYSALKLVKGPTGEVTGGRVLFDGKDITPYPAGSEQMRKIRGGQIGIVFQEPIMSLNPVLTVGLQIEESLRLHLSLDKVQAHRRAIEMLEVVGIPDAAARIHYYPHQFSGGMCQRVMIAMAICCNPKVLIADEATTALDVTTQEQILELLKRIAQQFGTAIILVTHNLGIVARYAQRIYVMYSGQVIESGSTVDIFKRPAHPYTSGLLHAVPRLDTDRDAKLVPIEGTPPRLIDKPDRCDFYGRCPYSDDICRSNPYPRSINVGGIHQVACHRHQEMPKLLQTAVPQEAPEHPTPRGPTGEPLLMVRDLVMSYPSGHRFSRAKTDIIILDKVNLQLRQGETLGLVGESGCGKSTIANCILRFLEPTGGQILFSGRDITHIPAREMRVLRRDIQIVSQNPYASLDPRQSVGSAIGEPLKVHRLCKTRSELDRRVEELMALVGLEPYMKDRMPHEFSGGQRQRVCIARALALGPKLLVCDEPVSALDVSIQAQIVNLFQDLQHQIGLSYLFVAHDLSVIRHISDRIAVMYLGQVVETAGWRDIYKHPMHPYTQALLSAVPIPDPEADSARNRVTLEGEVVSVVNRVPGCNFWKRCKFATEACKTTPPILTERSPGHFCACSHPQNDGTM